MLKTTRGRRALNAVVLVLAATWAGCVGAEGDAAPTTSQTTPAPEPQVDDSTGSITGIIVDEELRPIPRVKVVLVETMQTTETDEAGRFTFNGVAPGTYRLQFHRIGYAERTAKVMVQPGEVTEVDVTLVALEFLPEAYHTAFNRIAHIQFGQYTVQLLQNFINNSALNQYMCQGCRYDMTVPPNVSAAMTEGMYEKSIPGTMINEQFGVIFWRGYSETSYGTPLGLQYYKPPRTSYLWTDEQVKNLAREKEVRMQFHGPPPTAGIMVNQKVEAWQTLGFFGALPDDYTALPPP
jgi:5-hydroxyisourate hydrolase-like protein (transthyretin family)